jgi:hypothetical protein
MRTVIARSVSDEAIQLSLCCQMDCFAEPVIGRRFAPTRWLAMTVDGSSGQNYFTTAAVWPNSSLRSSSVRFTGWPKFGLISLALA